MSQAEIARARLIEIVPAGFEEVDAGDVVELAVYAGTATEEMLRAELGDVRSAPVEPGWEDRWRAFHRPVRAGGLWIGPPWEAAPAGVNAVVVDPARAFGTGAHATTRASIELLAGVPRGGVLDAGCGSGVLAVAAARLGFAPVVAVDVDPVAVEAARENAARNRVVVDVHELDVLADELPRTDVVVSNIELEAVEELLSRATSARAIVSGYLVLDRLRAPGWRRVARLQLEGWAADSLVRA